MEGARRTAIASILLIRHQLAVLVHLDPNAPRSPGRLDRSADDLAPGIQLAEPLVTTPLVGHDDPQPVPRTVAFDLRGDIEDALLIDRSARWCLVQRGSRGAKVAHGPVVGRGTARGGIIGRPAGRGASIRAGC